MKIRQRTNASGVDAQAPGGRYHYVTDQKYIPYDHLVKIKNSIPIVFVDRIPDMKEIHYVVCNMVSGTVQLVNYLLDKSIE